MTLNWKQYRDGTHRSCHPEDTFRRVAPFFPVIGITRVANVTGLDTIGIPVYMVVRPNSRSLAVSQGKGITQAAAKVSGIMEAIEIYHAERLDVDTRLGGFADIIAIHDVVDIETLSRNKNKIFDDETCIPWIKAKDISSNSDVWIPYELAHTDFTLPLRFDGGYFIADTNGLASGNSLIEAVVHGLCEVIERDALTLWALRSKAYQRERRVDLATIADPRNSEVIKLFEAANVSVAVWDISSDISLPVFLSKVVQKDQSDIRIRPAMGAGCHPNKSVALSRALTEAAQSRLTFICGARDDQPLQNYKNFQNGGAQDWIAEVLNETGSYSYECAHDFSSEFLEEDLKHIMTELHRTGLKQALYVDLTKKQFDIPVVKVVVPGLEGHTNSDHRIPGLRARVLLKEKYEHV